MDGGKQLGHVKVIVVFVEDSHDGIAKGFSFGLKAAEEHRGHHVKIVFDVKSKPV